MIFEERVVGEAHERDSFVYFDNGSVERRGSADVEVENFGAGLVADEEEIFEAFCDEESMFVAFAFEQGVGCDGGGESDVV